MEEVVLSRFTGFANVYDRMRPHPPKEIPLFILDILRTNKVKIVVDLGSGTGISTRIWGDLSEKIYGIEPNGEMRAVAVQNHREEKKIEFLDGTSYSTGLRGETADIVVCSQSFQWMEPSRTLQEVNRILRKGGVFVAVDHDWPPFVEVNCSRAYEKLFSTVKELRREYEKRIPKEVPFPKEKHLENILQSKYFEYCKEFLFHGIEECDAARFIGIAFSQGVLQSLLKAHVEEINEPLTQFIETVNKHLLQTRTMWISYRVRAGIGRK